MRNLYLSGIILSLFTSTSSAGLLEDFKTKLFGGLSTLEVANHPDCGCTPPEKKDDLVPLKKFIDDKDLSPQMLKVRQSVVRLCTCDACDTVFAVGKPGQFMTNMHVWDDLMKGYNHKTKNKSCDETPYLITSKGEEITSKVIPLKTGKWDHDEKNDDHSTDLVLLSIPDAKNVPFLQTADPKKIVIGTRVLMMGFPQGRFDYIDLKTAGDKPFTSDGTVTFKSSVNNSADFIGVNGMSGGPVVTEDGKVAGIFWGHKEQSIWESWSFKTKEKPQALPLPLLSKREESYFVPLEEMIKFIAE